MRLVLLIAGLVAMACPLLAISACLISARWQASAALDRWAKQSDYRIIRRSFRRWLRGPYFGMPATWAVFFVTVEDEDGFARDGWVLSGDPYFGTAEPLEVDWCEGR